MRNVFRKIFLLTFALMMATATIISVSAKDSQTFTGNGLDENISIQVSYDNCGDGDASASVSGGTVTGKVTGKKSGLFTKGESRTITVTIFNNSGIKSDISFDYECIYNGKTGYNSTTSLSITGQSSPNKNGGSATVIAVAPGGSAQVSVATGQQGNKHQLILKNIRLTPTPASVDVTVQFDGTLGKVTADNNAVTAGSTLTVDPSVGTVLKAAAIGDAKFLGWVNTDGTLLTTGDSITCKPNKNYTVRALFINSESPAHFKVDDAAIFDNMKDTSAYLANHAASKVLLLNSGYVSAGEYTIPAGVTLHIPHDDANTLNTTEPVKMVKNPSNWLVFLKVDSAITYDSDKPRIYRTMTMKDGAHLYIEGSLSLSGGQSSNQGTNGSPMGGLSRIDMEEGSSITIKSKGNLYCWGYITGSGEVIVKKGATAYESFQMIDWRGASAVNDMIDANKGKKVFPVSQYYVQNVEVPMTIEGGAMEYGYTSLVAGYQGFNVYVSATVPFVGQGGLFVPVDGAYIVKDYIESTDELRVDIYGDMEMCNLNINVGGLYNMESKDYVLPVNSAMNVYLHSGNTTISQSMAFLAGSYVEIMEDGKMTLDSGVNIFVYDEAEWVGKGYVFSLVDYRPVKYVNGGIPVVREAIGDAIFVVDGTMDASLGRLFTTAGGAQIVSNGGGKVIVNPANESASSPTKTYQMYQTATYEYPEIPITLAKLTNADGTYLASADGAAQNTYQYVEGKWVCTTHTPGTAVVENEIEATCASTGSYDSVTYCTICGEEAGRQNITVDALGHTAGEAVTENEVAATCTASGSYDTVIYCTECPAEISRETITVKASGHKEGQPVVENENLGDCLTNATHEDVVYCAECGEELSRTHVTDKQAPGHTAGTAADCETAQYCVECGAELVAALGHTYTPVVTAPTCTTGGYTTYTCDCGHSYVADEVSALGHTPAAAVQEDYSAPNCVTAGGYNSVVYCSVATCHEEISRTYVEIPALGHTPAAAVQEGYSAPNCVTAGGYDSVVYCSVENCGEELSREETIVPALGHNYVAGTTVEPDCVNGGYTTYTCSACGDSYNGNETNATGHSFTDYVSNEDATCTADGTKTAQCDNCTVTDTVVDADTKKDHVEGTAVEENRKASTTLVKGGYDMVIYCANDCGTELSRQHYELALAKNPYLGTNMSLKDSLSLNIAISVEGMNAGFTATITRAYGDGTTAPVTYDVTEEDWTWHDKSKGQAKFTYRGLAAKEMCDEITVTIYNEKGEVYAVITDSVRTYGERMVKKHTTKGKDYDPVQAAMYVDMLNYGAAAQVRFKYCHTDPEKLANAGLSEEQKMFATPDIAPADIVNVQSKNIQAKLTLQNTITMSIAVKASLNTNASYAVVFYTSHSGKGYSQRIELADFEKSGSYWVFAAPGLAIADGQTTVTVTIYDSNDDPISVNTDSMESFAGRKIGTTSEDADVLDKLLKFSRSAYAALHS